MSDIITNRMSHGDNETERGAALLNKGLPREALEVLQQALILKPKDALIYYNIGLAHHTLKDYKQAVSCYEMAVRQFPGFVEAYHNLGQAYTAQKKRGKAISAYQMALQLNPEDFNSAYNLGLLFQNVGDLDKAAAAIGAAIRANPSSANAFSVLGMIYSEQNKYEKALVCLDQAIIINPQQTTAYYYKGIIFQKTGHFNRAMANYRKAVGCDAAFAPAKWLLHLALPMIYDSSEQIDAYRRRFQNNLDHLIDSTPLESKAQKTFALRGIETTTNFYLQYQGRDDLRPQVKYGQFVHKVMSSNFPQWADNKDMPPLGRNEKIRIGYVSTFMYDHTVGTFLSGWLENHSRSEFDIHCYHMGRKIDATTHRLSQLSTHFRHYCGNMDAVARQIDEDNLHLLIYTDIGMHPITTLLAGLRLAPIQCKGWGHPVTTGLPTIDYYLSSDLMEPENADGFYSETLVRLPNLALCYRPPPLPDIPKTGRSLGIPTGRFVYLSTQSIFKYLPQHDDIYPRIALKVPQACFVFIRHQSDFATQRFKSRLRSVFATYGLDADHFCHFVNKMRFEDFLSLNLAADILLDSIDWSGGKTTLEALACGLPVVTLPGRFMRGRHAYAMLRMMKMSETVARDKLDYCEIAIRLGNDSTFYEKIKTRTINNRHLLYHDRIFIAALENFYKTIVTQRVNHTRTEASIP